MIDNLNLNLPAMRMPSQTKLNTQLRRPRKRIRIMRQQNIRHIAPHQMLNLRQHRPGAFAGNHMVALIIDAEQIEARAFVLNHLITCPKQAHAMLLKQPFRVIFHARINLMIPVAPPNPERSAQFGQFANASIQRIALARKQSLR